MIERRIYVSWAFSENEEEKRDMNNSIYKEDLKPKSKQFWADIPTEEELKTLTCYRCTGHGYGNNKYSILSNPHKFNINQLALICDGGNLCFGYRIRSSRHFFRETE
jgi:hypothetical protein